MLPNVIVLISDCLRKDHAYDKTIMPFLNSLNGTFFENAYAIAPNTHFAVSSMLTGKLPLSISLTWKIDKQKKQFMITNFLPDHHKMFITGNVITSSYYGFNHNFDFFEDFLKESNKEKLNEKIENIETFWTNIKKNKFISKFRFIYNIGKQIKKTMISLTKFVLPNQNININLKERCNKIFASFFDNLPDNKSVFSVLHLMEPHAPYCSINIDKHLIKKVRKVTKRMYAHKNLTQKEIKFLKERYTEETIDLDKALNGFTKKLKEHLDWDNTLLIIVSDHGEAFNETGYLTHPSQKISNPQHIKVPFIISGGFAKNLNLELADNKLIWNKDIYDIVLSIAKGNHQVKLKTQEFITGIDKHNEEHFMCSYFFPEKKVLFEGKENIFGLNNEYTKKIKKKIENENFNCNK